MQLFQHQVAGIEKIKKTNGVGAFFWDVGCGKTLAALKVFEHYKQENKDLKLFVVCPVSLIEPTWGEDIRKFTRLSYSNLRKYDSLNANIIIINFETLISRKFASKLREIISLPNLMCVIDESQRIKSYNAKTTKYLLNLSKYFKHRLILTATPAPNSELEYWSQISFLNPQLLGKNYFAFRNMFFWLERGNSHLPLSGLGRREMTMMMQRGYKMKIKSGSEKLLSERIAPYCQFVDKRDALDLPDEIDEIRAIEMTDTQAKSYRQMYHDLVTEIEGEEISVQNALSKLMKLRQISSGFAYNREGKAIEFKPNPKMNELINVLDEIGNKKVIIFCQYKWEIEAIFEKYSHKSAPLYSKTKNKDLAIEWFKGSNAGYLIAHPLSGGVGLSFNDCDYMIFYSMDYSYMNYHQCRGRIMRAEKKNNATYIHLIAEKSLDRIILQAVRNKHNNVQVFQSILSQNEKRKI